MGPDEFAKYSRDLLKSMNEMKKKSVTVGIQSEDATKRAYDGDVTVLQVGIFHELGLGVPRRSFIELPFTIKKSEMNKRIDAELNKLINGKTTPENALGLIGMEATNIVKMAFTSSGYGTWEPSEGEDGGQVNLIDTGILRNSISYKVVQDA